MPTRSILGADYQTAIMPDGREWMIQDLAATGSGMSTQSTAYGQRYMPDAAFLAVMATLSDGWHLPTSDEWDAMGAAVNPARGSVGELTEAGGDLKALTGWNAPNTGAGLNVGGFSLQPNKTAGTVGWWWTATLATPTSRRNVEVFHDGRGLAFAGNGTDNYAAVRLVRDAPAGFSGAKVYSSGSWRNGSGVYVSSGGAWRKANKIFVPVSGAWREVQ